MYIKKALSILTCAAAICATACNSNNVDQDESLKTYFNKAGVTGSFAVHNNISNRFVVYNFNRYRDSSYAPGATFYIMNALIGIEKGVVNHENSTFVNDPAAAALKDTSFDVAFKNNSAALNQYLAQKIGKEYMQKWLDSLHYGNTIIKDDSTSFWNNDSLRLTSDEQLGLMKKLYFDQLPFQKRTQDIVKKQLLKISTANYALSYQQSVATNAQGKLIGWIVGWEEENKHVYFFTLNTEAKAGTNLAEVQPTLLKEIMAAKGFFKGNK